MEIRELSKSYVITSVQRRLYQARFRNAVLKAYRELEHEGVIELRHGSGAFVSPNRRAGRVGDKLRAAQPLVAGTVERLRARGLNDEEIRRLFEAELAVASRKGARRG